MKPDVMSSQCSSRRYLASLTSKWSILIVNALGRGSLRNGELLRTVEGISQKMLTQTLQELTALNIVQRDDKKTIPPHVEYKLTVLGHSFPKTGHKLSADPSAFGPSDTGPGSNNRERNRLVRSRDKLLHLFSPC